MMNARMMRIMTTTTGLRRVVRPSYLVLSRSTIRSVTATAVRTFVTKRQQREPGQETDKTTTNNDRRIVESDGVLMDRRLTQPTRSRFLLPPSLQLDHTNTDTFGMSTSALEAQLQSSSNSQSLEQLLQNSAMAYTSDSSSSAAMGLDPNIHMAHLPDDWSGYESPPTPLWEHVLLPLLAISGRPLSTAGFMELALTHPEFGYYTNAKSKRQPISGKGGNRSAGSSSSDSSNKTEEVQDDFDVDDYDLEEYTTTDQTTESKQDGDNDTIDDSIVVGGDFITSPEISSCFAEMIGVWFAALQQELKKQQPIPKYVSQLVNNHELYQWIELGPGKGTLMADLLQFVSITGHRSGLGLCSKIHLIETSPVLRDIQKQTLQKWEHDNQQRSLTSTKVTPIQLQFHDMEYGYTMKNNTKEEDGKGTTTSTESNNNSKTTTIVGTKTIDVHWHVSWEEFSIWQQRHESHLKSYVVGQEYLDALPVYSFEKTKEGYWRERLVDLAVKTDLEESDDDEEDKKSGTNASSTTSDSAQQQQQQEKKQGATTDSSSLGGKKKPRLRIVLAPSVTPALQTLLPVDKDGFMIDDYDVDNNNNNNNSESTSPPPPGTILEVCPLALLLVQDVARMLQTQGGAALFIDYGNDETTAVGDSLRGYSRQEQVLFTSRPGEVDITADVDFTALKQAVNRMQWNNKQQQQQMNNPFNDDSMNKNTIDIGTTTTKAGGGENEDEETKIDTVIQAFGPVEQGHFLMTMGLGERVLSFIENPKTTPKQQQDLYDAMVRLAAPEEMGKRYKVLALAPTVAATSSSSTEPPQQPPPPKGRSGKVIPPPGF